MKVADSIEKKLGSRPYLVLAKFSRLNIDANRPTHNAFESPDAAPYYQAYHGHIRAFVDEIRQRYRSGALLIDIHGQSNNMASIFRGTRNLLTVRRIVRKEGVEAITGPDSIAGYMQAHGYDVLPNPQSDPNGMEDSRYNGGFTVWNYGSNFSNGIDAMQFEIGKGLRYNSDFVEQFADAIVDFDRHFLNGPEMVGKHD